MNFFRKNISYQCLVNLRNSLFSFQTSFHGTDNLQAIVSARDFYGSGGSEMPATSVPASEHSVMTSWGRTREVDATRVRLISLVLKIQLISF
jgi:nicotinic acid phosphoribosyltransferase